MKKSIALTTLLLGATLNSHAADGLDISDYVITRPVKSTTSFVLDADNETCSSKVTNNKYVQVDSHALECTVDDVMAIGNAADLGDSYIPMANLGAGEKWTLTLKYDITRLVPEDLFLSALKLTYVMFDEEGNTFYDNEARSVTFSLKLKDSAGNVLAEDTQTKTISDESTYETNSHGVEFNIGTEEIVLGRYGTAIEDDFQVELTAEMAGGTGDAYYGLRNTEMSFVARVVPEPTTATLSLLALAGLAARRRRH